MALPDKNPDPLTPEPPPSFQPAGLANKSAANTGAKATSSSARGQLAIAQKTRSLSVAIKAATLAKPVLASGGEGSEVAIHDPDFGIYSHSEQVRQRHYYSRLTLNLFAVLFIGGMVISVWSFWPKLSGWWAGVATTDQQYFDNIIDGLLAMDNQKYQVELETTIDQFGQTDIANIGGEFISNQVDPANPGLSQSAIELDFRHQLSVATATSQARYETIVIGVDQIRDPTNQTRYLRIRPLKFNQNQVTLTELHQTWARLDPEDSPAGANPTSLILSLADDLTTNYDHYDYTILLPNLNLSNPAQRSQAREYLLANSPYHPFDCQIDDSDASHLVTCQFLIESDKIYQFYRYAYQEILKVDIPERYNDLRQQQTKLPERFSLTIDTRTQQPTRLETSWPRLVAGQEIPDQLIINYQPDPEDQIEIPANPLTIKAYRQRLQQFEANNQALFN